MNFFWVITYYSHFHHSNTVSVLTDISRKWCATWKSIFGNSYICYIGGDRSSFFHKFILVGFNKINSKILKFELLDGIFSSVLKVQIRLHVILNSLLAFSFILYSSLFFYSFILLPHFVTLQCQVVIDSVPLSIININFMADSQISLEDFVFRL